MERRLADLHILALDCQATGANPGRGQLLEIGWVAGSAASASMPDKQQAQSHLIRQPPQTPIPPVVRRLTGITEDAMTAAVTEKVAWQSLDLAIRNTAARNPSALCPAVIHFARFEEPFLRQLYASHDPRPPFPLHIICTHAIAARLLPELPRRGIRALAGYFGHAMPELRRSADHARATLMIWKALVNLLENRCQVSSLSQLTRWLNDSPPPGRTTRVYPMDPGMRRDLPDKPGIYRMRRDNGDILYIGKAKSLKKRVNSYFRTRAPHAEHILEMLSQARNLDCSTTSSALEAALLESDEIKRHLPPYNKALRPERRSLVFLSRDLKAHSPAGDRRHCIGPLLHDRLIDALQAFAAWLEQGMQLPEDDPAGGGCLLLALPPAHVPDIDCLQQGLDLFRSNHLPHLRHRSALRAAAVLGAQLRRRQLEAAAEVEEGSPDDGQEFAESETADQPAWTPQTVSTVMEHMLSRAAHLIRRARWYALLSESCLTWTPAGKTGGSKNLLVIEGGAVVRSELLPLRGNPPAPPGVGRPWGDRRKAIDLAAYDRLRILTTELRRLVYEGRDIELRLGPHARMLASDLKRALPWI